MRFRYLMTLVAMFVCYGCTTVSVDDEDVVVTPDYTTADDVVEWMDGVLSVNYLYNDEYNTLTRDLNQSYSTFLSSTLATMTTNVLDCKNGSLYSNITRTATSKSTTRSKSTALSFGLASCAMVTYGTGTFTQAGLAVLAVFDGSPLAEAGICRGDIIWRVGGVQITSSNASTYASFLLSPTAEVTYEFVCEGGKTATASTDYIYCSPILKSEIFSDNVGYISYFNFNSDYDSDLLSVFSEFKSAGVKELILDMRLNVGGVVSTANKISTIIAGDKTSGRTFAKYEYNPTRMASGKETETENFLSSLKNYHLDLDRVYCLVGSITASASELVINSLEGIDFEVILIGSQTRGKNVAMEVEYKTFDSWEYTFQPVTILVSNEKGFNDYADGFAPDYYVDEWDSGNNFADYTEDEVLIKTALDLISGESTTQLSTTTRSDDGVDMSLGEPLIPNNQRSGNVIE